MTHAVMFYVVFTLLITKLFMDEFFSSFFLSLTYLFILDVRGLERKKEREERKRENEVQ